MKQNNTCKGKAAEDIAVKYLEENGFMVLDKNFFARKLGEIDIVAQKLDTLHFIEVKSSNSDIDSALNITTSKLEKLKRSVEYYLQKKSLSSFNISIDAVLIDKEELRYLENITN